MLLVYRNVSGAKQNFFETRGNFDGPFLGTRNENQTPIAKNCDFEPI